MQNLVALTPMDGDEAELEMEQSLTLHLTQSRSFGVVFTVNHLTDTDKLKKQTMQNTAKQNYPGSVTSYYTRPGNEMGLFYSAPEPTQ